MLNHLKYSQFRVFQESISSNIHLARHYAMSKKRRTFIQVNQRTIYIKSTTKLINKLEIPKLVKCTEKGGIGFTKTGTASKSGSLNCKYKNNSFKITVGIGYSKITIYE